MPGEYEPCRLAFLGFRGKRLIYMLLGKEGVPLGIAFHCI